MTPYPRGELDQKGALLYKLGTFWYSQYEDPEFLETFYRATCDDYEEQYQLFLDTSVLSRQQAPVYQKRWWQLLTIKRSEVGDVDAAKILYGQAGLTYGDGSVYGQKRLSSLFLYPVTTNIAAIRVIFNRMSGPTATLLPGIDFETFPGYIAFRGDPFADSRFASRPIYDLSGSLVDYEIALWGFALDMDAQYLWNHVGYVVGRNYPSSQVYKDYLNAIWDAHCWGPTTLNVRQLIAAAVGMPLVGSDGEVVEKILTYGALTIITDRAVYTYSEDAVATVAVGDVVNTGDTLTNGLEFVELFGNTQNITSFEGIALNSGMLRDPYLGSLYFINKACALEYLGPDSDGYVEVRFPISGFPLDVEQFWDLAHARGKAAGATLAHLLDRRTSSNGEPQPQNLPATINPMEVVTQLIGANFLLVHVRSALVPAGAPGIHGLGALRDVMPPQTAVILYVEIDAEQETYAYDDIVDGVISFEYGITAPEAALVVDDPEGLTYVMVGDAFVLVGGAYVVIGSGVEGATPESYGHLVPIVRQVETDCA